MNFMDWLSGTSGSYDQISRFTPEQQQQFGQLLSGIGQAQGGGLDWISKILSGDSEAMSQFEAPFQRQFQQETVPGLAERFAGMGSGMGSGSSSAFNQTMGQSGRELSEQLAALRGGLQQNALGALQGMMGQAYSPTFENIYNQPTHGALMGGLNAVGQGAGAYAGMHAMPALAGMSALGSLTGQGGNQGMNMSRGAMNNLKYLGAY